MSFGSFMYSKLCIVILDPVDLCSCERPCHCGIVSVFDVKNVTLESINDSVFCLTYIFNVAPIAFQTVYKVIALESAIS